MQKIFKRLKTGSPFDHTIEALKHSRSNDPVINLSILLHDVGKGATYQPQKEHKGRVRIHTYDGHDVVGAKIIEQIGRRLKMPNDDIDAIKFAAYRHMVLHNPERLSFSKLTGLVNNKYWPVLKEVVYCDEMSRGDQDSSEIAAKLDNVEKSVREGVGDETQVKQKIKKLVDGNKLMQWIPEILQNKPLIGQVLSKINEYLIDNKIFDIPEEELKQIAISIYEDIKNV